MGIAKKIEEQLLPRVDALNIDLKSFDAEVYRKMLGGDLETVKGFVERANAQCHVELTTLIVPEMNDSEEEIRAMTDWIASLPGGGRDPAPSHALFPALSDDGQSGYGAKNRSAARGNRRGEA